MLYSRCYLESTGNLYLGILINLIQKKGQAEADQTVVGNKGAANHVSQGTGMFGHFCGLVNTHVLPAFRHDYRGVLSLS